MARYRGPVEKLERRFGVSLALKGERRLSGKSALDKRPYGPGQHGARKGKDLIMWFIEWVLRQQEDLQDSLSLTDIFWLMEKEWIYRVIGLKLGLKLR